MIEVHQFELENGHIIVYPVMEDEPFVEDNGESPGETLDLTEFFNQNQDGQVQIQDHKYRRRNWENGGWTKWSEWMYYW